MNNFRRRAQSGLTFNADHETVINGITFVDLGLPSGILWAKSNLYTEYKTFREAKAYGSGKIICPSKTQVEELMNNAQYSQYGTTTYQGRSARKITGKNSAIIYFVSAGYKTMNGSIQYNTNPYAWTTSQAQSGTNVAYAMTRGGYASTPTQTGTHIYMTDQLSVEYSMSIWPIYVP